MGLAQTHSEGVHEIVQLLCTLHEECTQNIKGVLALIEVLHEHVYLTDSNGLILYANPATVRATGFTLDEMRGHTSELWRLQGEDGGERSIWNQVVDHMEMYHGIVRNERKDGTLYEVDVQVLPILDADGAVRYCLAIERDISNDQHLERTERRLMSLLSHNLKTPLASIRWQAEMLRDGDAGRLSKQQLEYVEEMLAGVTRTVAMVEQWFDVTKMDLGLYESRPVPVDLDEIVQRALTELAPRIEQEGVTVHVTKNPLPCTISADSDMLYTVAHTLLLNAVKYNREGGTVDVATVTLPAQNEFAGRKFAEVRVILSVRDSGLGILPEDQHKVFREFFHGTNINTTQAGGAGLGLYLAYAFIRKLHGDIWFTSSEQGSHFVVACKASDVRENTTAEEPLLTPTKS